MPVFILGEAPLFPPPYLSEKNGLLAVGGDLRPQRLIVAYRMGIFPWYNEGEPILWWSPDPRFVLFPEEVKVSRSMRQILKKGLFRVTFDTDFAAVIEGCRKPRGDRVGTWIDGAMSEAFCALHALGIAHSVEVWREGELVGGLYGVALGRCFFGESMFTRESNASKVALIRLCQRLREEGFVVIDCQVYTAHLESMGARMIPRRIFLEMLARHAQGDSPLNSLSPADEKW